MLINILYKLFKKQILSIHAKEQIKKIEFSQLEKAFVDLDGRQYYRFPISVAMPISRIGKAQDLISWMVKGVSDTEYHQLLDKQDKLLTEGLLHKKNAAKIGAITSELRDRANMVVHTEIVYNFLAVKFVREDENPGLISDTIHLEKVEAFKKMDSECGFFLNTPELKMLSDSLNMSGEEWMKAWQESIVKQEALKEAMKTFLSESQ